MLAAVGFCLFGAVVNEDGTVNHTLSIFSVYPHRDPYPPSYAQGYAMGRNDNTVLRGAVGAEDDRARVVIHILSLSLEVLNQSFLKPNYTPRTGCLTQCCWREPRNRTWANIGIYVLLFKFIQYYCHWIVGKREDVGWSDSLVACGYGCRTTSVGHIHHLSVTPPHSDGRDGRRESAYTPSFFLSIFSLNNRSNSSPNAATPLSVNTE